MDYWNVRGILRTENYFDCKGIDGLRNVLKIHDFKLKTIEQLEKEYNDINIEFNEFKSKYYCEWN